MNLLEGLLWYLVFLFSTVFHEASHAFAAWRLGDNTGYQGGQVTLDPMPHIRREPIGLVVVPILSFLFGGMLMGWASAPYNAYWARAFPKRAAIMSLAGPTANLILVGLSVLLMWLGSVLKIFSPPSIGYLNYSHVIETVPGSYFSIVATLLSITFSLNIILFLFNLLPIPPLDGSGVIPAFLGRRQAVQYMDWVQQPTAQMIGLILCWH
ncbi:MAG: site-2 protease family protein, partial [Planctomycetota bacterium]